MRRSILSIFSWISPTVYSLLLLSQFSVKIFTISGSYLFEIALAISLVYGFVVQDPIARSVIRIVKNKRPPAILALCIITTVFLLGILIGGNVAYAYADYRANVFALLGFLILWDFKNRDPLPLIQLGIVTGIFFVAGWYLNINDDSSSAVSSSVSSAKFSSPYVCMLIAIILSCQSRRIILAILAAVILALLAAVSFYRQYWIATACGIFYLISYTTLRLGSRSRLRLALSVLIGAMIAALVAPSYISKIEDYFVGDESHYIQSVGKTQNTIDVLTGNFKHLTRSALHILLSFSRSLGKSPFHTDWAIGHSTTTSTPFLRASDLK
jgi:hypothetical protein